MLNRRVTLPTPKQLDPDTAITGGQIEYAYFHDESLTAYMRGGAISETIPLAGLEPADAQLAEAFMAMLVRLMSDEVTGGTAKGRVEADRKAAEEEKARQEREAREAAAAPEERGGGRP